MMRNGNLNNMPKKYRSGLESRLHTGVLKKCAYEPMALEYMQLKNYIPDFVWKKIIFEAKGRFRTYAEASKYIDVQKHNPDYTLIFIFSNPNLPMPGAKPRKDGTKLTHGDWAAKNGFQYYTETTIPKRLLR